MTVRKKAIALAAALVLCLTAAIGITAAYFTDYESAAGGAKIELGGQTRINEEMDQNDKNVSITNTGQTDMIVRVGVFSDAGRTTIEAGNDWIKGADDWYYYRYVLAGSEDGTSGESTSVLRVIVKTDDTSAAPDFDVLAAHESAEAVYNGQSEPDAPAEDLRLEAPEGWDADAVAEIRHK